MDCDERVTIKRPARPHLQRPENKAQTIIDIAGTAEKSAFGLREAFHAVTFGEKLETSRASIRGRCVEV